MKNISFVIPTIGKSSRLKELVKEIRAFCQNCQIILVDNSINGFSELKNIDAKIEYYYLPSAGVSKSRNFGASKAKGDYIYFLDDDVIPNHGWNNALNNILLEKKFNNSLIGGPVLILNDVKKLVPSKYSYLVGEKVISNKDCYIKKNYLSACNIIFKRTIFYKLGGFPEKYGHKNGQIILNEEIFLQEKSGRLGINIYYKHNLSVTHYWQGNRIFLRDRVKLQGFYDRELDNQLNKSRLLLRLIKYIILIPFKWFYVHSLNNQNGQSHFDLLKYGAYVRHKI